VVELAGKEPEPFAAAAGSSLLADGPAAVAVAGGDAGDSVAASGVGTSCREMERWAGMDVDGREGRTEELRRDPVERRSSEAI